MRFRIAPGLIPLLLGIAFAQHPNVFISQARQPNEPAIAVDPRNPARMAGGANQDNVYRSDDGGRTWRGDSLTSRYNVRGDPSLAADTTGAFYFFHLSDSMGGQGYSLDRIVCQRLDSGGSGWDSGTGIGLKSLPAVQDKEWPAVDPRSNALYVTWTQFDHFNSTDPADSSNILFSKSLDRGATWNAPLRINQTAGDCLDSGFTVEGAVPAIGPNGEIYVSWMGPAGLVFDRSLDGGQTWLAQDIRVDSMPSGWNFAVPGLSRANGFPVTACDASSGPGRGNVYISWSDQENGPTDTDVWFRKSTDGGLTWGPRIRVNDDPPGRQQFFPWMSVDPATGHIWIAFYDRRNHADSTTDVYLACSRDNGSTFVNFRVSSEPFTPDPGFFLGDYLNISAAQGVVRPIWIRMDSVQTWMERSVWTALVDTSRIGQDQSAIRFVARRRGKTANPWLLSAPNFGRGSLFIDVLGRRHGPAHGDDRFFDPDLPRPAAGHSAPEEWKEKEDEEEREDGMNRWLAVATLATIGTAVAVGIRRRILF